MSRNRKLQAQQKHKQRKRRSKQIKLQQRIEYGRQNASDALSKIAATVSSRANQRQCGDCTECCTAMAVIEIGKPERATCKHLSTCGGCSIYNTRPASCAAWECGWRMGVVLDEADRPDKIGLMVNMVADDNQSNGRLVVSYYELKPGALGQHANRIHQQLIATYGDNLTARFIPLGAGIKPPDPGFKIDETMYPAVGTNPTYLTSPDFKWQIYVCPQDEYTIAKQIAAMAHVLAIIKPDDPKAQQVLEMIKKTQEAEIELTTLY